MNPTWIPAIIGGATLFLAVSGILVAWALRVAKGERASTDVLNLERRHESLKKEFNDYRVEAARNFASHQTLIEVESRLDASLNRLGDRFDRALERAATQS